MNPVVILFTAGLELIPESDLPVENSEKIEDLFSGFHIPFFELSENENRWENVAFARYYGIKGIRMEKDKDDLKQEIVKTEASPAIPQSR